MALDRIAKLETELAEAHTLLDQDGVQIIRNHKDGYPEGRPNVEMTLVERVKAVCRMVHDWRRWHNDLEAKLVEARKDSERLEWLFSPIIPKTDKGEDAFATWHCAYRSRHAIDNAMKGQDDE